MSERQQRTDDGDPRDGGADPVLHHDAPPGVGDYIGEAAGGLSGVFAGAAIGAAGGPVGTIIGGLAGAIGGWWAGRTVSEAASRMTGGDDDTQYRSQYEESPTRLADRSYDDVRPAYHLGHLAALNPEYHGHDFDRVETDLAQGWTADVRARHGDWQSVRGYARDAFARSRARLNAADAAAAGGRVERLGHPTTSAARDAAALAAPEPADGR